MIQIQPYTPHYVTIGTGAGHRANSVVWCVPHLSLSIYIDRSLQLLVWDEKIVSILNVCRWKSSHRQLIKWQSDKKEKRENIDYQAAPLHVRNTWVKSKCGNMRCGLLDKIRKIKIPPPGHQVVRTEKTFLSLHTLFQLPSLYK